MNPNRVSFLSAPVLLTIMLLPAPATAGDRIAEMCALAEQAMPEQNEGCACALEKVTEQISEDDFDLYAEVGTVYFANMANGQARAEAWDGAAKSAGEPRGMSLVDVLQITNPIGQLHQEALRNCQ